VSRRPRLSRTCIAAGLALAAPIGAALAQPLPAGVADCLARIEQERAADPAAEPGLDRVNPVSASSPLLLGDVCPELAAALDSSSWGEALAGVRADELSTSAFESLAELVADYERPAARAPAPSAESLDDVLAEVRLREPVAALTIWDRIQQWYEEHFGTQQGEVQSRLERWLEGLTVPEQVVRYLVIALGIVVVVATVLVVVNELRIAGVLASGVLRKYSPLAPVASDDAPRARDLDDVARAPLARRPALLLALVLDRLRARGAAPLRDSLTHRELVGATGGLTREQSEAFGAVVGAAERVTYGGWRPEPQDVDGVVARGRALLASLADAEVAR